mgnify:CR=1 FL=1
MDKINNMDKYDYINMTPFKWFVLENFPFIEADFDALTNWQLFCKLGKEMNKVIDKVNECGEQVENLTNAYLELQTYVNNFIEQMLDDFDEFKTDITGDFNDLQDYVNNYFDNLDVQEEINNKLDDMVEQGTLQEIIISYLQINGILAFNTVADMVVSENLTNGSYVETYGFYSIGDGGSAKYKIRNATNEDTPDNMTLFSLTNLSGLVAELVIPNTINSMQIGIQNNLETDSASKLNKFFSINTSNYILKTGIYYIDSNISINSNSNITFEEGAKVIRIPTLSDTYFMFDVADCENVELNNIHLIGDKDEHLGNSGEWGYGINITGSKNITIKNSIIEKTWGDGIYVGYKYSSQNPLHCENVLIENCNILSVSRNGISLCAGKHFRVNNCYAYGITRTDPKAGIDIEAEGPDGATLILEDVEINNLTTQENTIGISVGIRNITDFKSIIINNHNAIEDKYGIVFFSLDGEGNFVYQNANIIKCFNTAIQITKKNQSNLIIKNINIDSNKNHTTDQHNYWGAITILTDSATNGNLIIDGINLTKTFTNLYDFKDIICERGSGTFNKLILKNIFTEKLLCVNNVDINTFDLTNCVFLSKSGGATIDLNKNRIHNVCEIIETQYAELFRNIKTTLPNGTYKITFSVNTVPYFFNIVFDSGFTVYLPSQTTASATKTFRSSKVSETMTFIKKGNIITITQSTFA